MPNREVGPIRSERGIVEMRVVVIGGTGFLGHFIVSDLVRRGHSVHAFGFPPAPPFGYLPPSTEITLSDIGTLSDRELVQVFGGAGAVVFGGGADGRDLFPQPAIDGYREANVKPMERLIPLLIEAGCPKLIILGSYYTALDRTFPELNLARVHPYIASRKEQSDLALALAGSNLAVGILELPYIFGAAPGKGTLWGFVIDKIQKEESVPTPTGGTSCTTGRQVGEATAAACERLEGHRHFAIVNSNHSFLELYKWFAESLGLNRTWLPLARDEALSLAQQQLKRLAAEFREQGMNPIALVEAQGIPLYLDPLPAQEQLSFHWDDMRLAVEDSVKATLAYPKKRKPYPYK